MSKAAYDQKQRTAAVYRGNPAAGATTHTNFRSHVCQEFLQKQRERQSRLQKARADPAQKHYVGMKVTELKSELSRLGVAYHSTMLKADLLDKLLEHVQMHPTSSRNDPNQGLLKMACPKCKQKVDRDSHRALWSFVHSGMTTGRESGV